MNAINRFPNSDLNRSKAETLEQSDYTSVQRRIESLDAPVVDAPVVVATALTDGQPLSDASANALCPVGSHSPDGFLSPVSLEEVIGTPGPNPSKNEFRCSDKGFLPISLPDYPSLLDWTARQLHGAKRGRALMTVKPILERLGLKPSAWSKLVSQFGRLFINVAGKPKRSVPPAAESASAGTTSAMKPVSYFPPSKSVRLGTLVFLVEWSQVYASQSCNLQPPKRCATAANSAKGGRIRHPDEYSDCVNSTIFFVEPRPLHSLIVLLAKYTVSPYHYA